MARQPSRRGTGGSTGHSETNGDGAGGNGRTAPEPEFAQPEPAAAPGKFRDKHLSDKEAYAMLDKLRAEHELKPTGFPESRGGSAARLSLEQIWGSAGAQRAKDIEKAGQLVFHAVGDTGNTRSVQPQESVSEKMEADFDDDAKDAPAFFLHLGDVVYSFGELKYYYDQFYEPYRNYPAPIVAIAGNHDGMVAPGSTTPALEAFWQNFCSEEFQHLQIAGGLSRTTMIQPGVYYLFEAPFIRIICLYSNTLEDPGVISSEGNTWTGVSDAQLDFLKAALQGIKNDQFHGAVVIAVHHPAYTTGKNHNGSPNMLAEMDRICEAVGVWPHAVLSGHAHSYQRYTRKTRGMEIPYITAGNGGHGLSRLRQKGGGAIRVPAELTNLHHNQDTVVFENYDDADYGYLRIIVNSAQLRIEYHPASDGKEAKTPDDHVTVDLAKRTIGQYFSRHKASV